LEPQKGKQKKTALISKGPTGDQCAKRKSGEKRKRVDSVDIGKNFTPLAKRYMPCEEKKQRKGKMMLGRVKKGVASNI